MKKSAWLLGLLLTANVAWADNVSATVEKLQHEWAVANYSTAKDKQEDAFKALADRAHQATASNPNRAEVMVWEAIILSTYAKVKGGLGALGLAEKSRDLLLAAEKIDPNTLNGSIYTSLGSLFYKVPGWPIGFGDKKKAREYLEKALKQNPDGIDPNYFYGDFLAERGEYVRAKQYLEKALKAPARPGREDADKGRRDEIREALKRVESHL